ncbi:MAG: hypothetical protein R3C59_14615 [Planctomycetaceae bacterium]
MNLNSSPHLVLALLLTCSFSFPIDVSADDPQPAAASDAAGDSEELKEGHSSHGEVFNEGPRQAAYLMDGVGTIEFEVTSKSEEAKAFVLQGIGQLHGFWYFESERSFRQAAMLDPDCAIAYWGMAMSNRKNAERAKGFIKEAMDRKDKASKREQLYVEAFHEYINAKAGTSEEKTKRAEKYIGKLDDILIAHPDDLEAKAFLCEFLWSAKREGFDMPSYVAVDAMIQDILDRQPLHPAHHYRIHLWDSKKAANALESAANCGLAAPAIAHMWHMPGHIYSKLNRYHDAVYQQEASARVDHAHMMKDRVLPDQIHNFAHNNEWCIRNLIHIGRVSDAIELAKNMIQLPQHPKYNTISKGSFKFGRERLLDVLRTYQLHADLIRYSETPYLAACGSEKEDLKSDRYVAAACVETGDTEKATALRTKIQCSCWTQSQKNGRQRGQSRSRSKSQRDGIQRGKERRKGDRQSSQCG